MRYPVLLFILLCSCNNPVELPENYIYRFNIEQYFISEAELLNAQSTGIIKEIYKNELSETVIIESPDWKKELQPFLQIKLNKPAQVNSFSVDSTKNNEQLTVEYSAKETNEDLRKLRIFFTGSTQDSIIAIRSTSNIYYKYEDTITYLGNWN
jgi:hypothetical protein